MSSAVHFKRRPDAVDLEIIKVRCWRSWFSSQVMPTKVVETLVEEVDLLHTEMTKLHKELAQAKLDAEIYEGMYDTKCKERDATVQRLTVLCVKLGIDYWPVNI